jgi:hypothetical protein
MGIIMVIFISLIHFNGTGVDTIDVAMWNYIQCDSSDTNRAGGTVPGNASAYTSTYDVDWDENGNLYSQSHYGWTVEKWHNDNFPLKTAVRDEMGEARAVRKDFALDQNYPNPFNPTTTIRFTLSEPGLVELKVYDLQGREVKTIISETMIVGTHQVIFNASDMASGVYYYTLTHNGQKQT